MAVSLSIPIQVHLSIYAPDDISDRNVDVTEFITPTAIRKMVKQSKGDKYGKRKDAQIDNARRKALRRREEDVLAVSKVLA